MLLFRNDFPKIMIYGGAPVFREALHVGKTRRFVE